MARVWVLDNFTTGRRPDLDSPDVSPLQGDARDAAMRGRAVDGVEVVIHLAAFGSVVDSIADPPQNWEADVLGTLNMLRACVRSGACKFSFASKGGALIANVPLPVDEQNLPWFPSPYGVTKLRGEPYCHASAGSCGFEPSRSGSPTAMVLTRLGSRAL